jgi:hypothetical protein
MKWFISYNASGYDNGKGCFGNCVSDKSPAEWALDLQLDESIKDGPYVILYAEKISDAAYKRHRDQW